MAVVYITGYIIHGGRQLPRVALRSLSPRLFPALQFLHHAWYEQNHGPFGFRVGRAMVIGSFVPQAPHLVLGISDALGPDAKCCR